MIKEILIEGNYILKSNGEIWNMALKEPRLVKKSYCNKVKAWVCHLTRPKQRQYVIKNLIAKHFIPEFDTKTQKIVFKDGDENNLSIDNYKIVNRYLNLKDDDYKNVLDLKEKGYTWGNIAKLYHCSDTGLRDAIARYTPSQTA